VSEAALVRAPIGAVYRTLTDLDGWPTWHDGCRSRRLDMAGRLEPAVDPADRHALVLPGVRGVLRIEVDVHGWRHDAGVAWDIRWGGRRRAPAAADWWLEECREGVIVHHLLHEPVGGPPGGREARALLRYRGAVMLALQAMKDRLELAVAHAAGSIP
jgi:hypothetical protein